MTVGRQLPTNSKTIEPVHISIAFIDEYKTHRQKPHTLTQNIMSKLYEKTFNTSFNRLSTHRRNECDDLIKKFETASTYEEKSKIIDTLSEYAKNAQAAKEYYLKYPDFARNLFTNDDSLWALALHAIRTYWVAYLRDAFSTEFNAEIDRLKTELRDVQRSINKQLDNKVRITKLEDERRKSLFLALLDREDQGTLKLARLNNAFPAFLPQGHLKASTDQVKIYDEYALVYNPNFHSIYFFNLIKNTIREINFYNVLKKYLAKYSVQDVDFDITKAGFFDTGIMSEGLIEENEINQQSSSSKEELNQDEEDSNIGLVGLFSSRSRENSPSPQIESEDLKKSPATTL